MVFLLRACVPPMYFRPVRTRDSCFARTRNLSQASFAVPSLKYFLDSFSQTAVVKILVGPLRGSCLRQVASGTGNTVFLTFSRFSSSDDGGPYVFKWVEESFGDVQLYEGSHCTVYHRH